LGIRGLGIRGLGVRAVGVGCDVACSGKAQSSAHASARTMGFGLSMAGTRVSMEIHAIAKLALRQAFCGGAVLDR
jgi:hypothetical protein